MTNTGDYQKSGEAASSFKIHHAPAWQHLLVASANYPKLARRADFEDETSGELLVTMRLLRQRFALVQATAVGDDAWCNQLRLTSGSMRGLWRLAHIIRPARGWRRRARNRCSSAMKTPLHFSQFVITARRSSHEIVVT